MLDDLKLSVFNGVAFQPSTRLGLAMTCDSREISPKLHKIEETILIILQHNQHYQHCALIISHCIALHVG